MTDREGRIEEFRELWAKLPGPAKVDRVRQAARAMGLAREDHVRRYIMTVPDRAPSRQGLRMLRAHVERLADLNAAAGEVEVGD